MAYVASLYRCEHHQAHAHSAVRESQEVPQRVVNLGEVRDILQSWEEVRQKIVAGKVKAFALTLQCESGQEAVFYGGVYKASPKAAFKASLRQSWEMTKANGTRP